MRLLPAILAGLCTFAGRSYGQDVPSVLQVGGFVVSSLPNTSRNPFCAITGPSTAAFQMRIVVTRIGTIVLSVINSDWNLAPGTKGTVTLRADKWALTREFTPATGTDAKTALNTYITRQDPDPTASTFASTVFEPGSRTEAVFPGGQSFVFVAPPAETDAAFKDCLKRLRSDQAPPNPFAPGR